MARFGHASPRAAMIYRHAADDPDRRIAEGLDAMAEEAGLSAPEAARDEVAPSIGQIDDARRRRHPTHR